MANKDEEVKIPTKEELLNPPEEKVVEGDVQEGELSPEEDRAIQDGWVPKDQWKGNPAEWRSAKEFNERGEFFRRIKEQSAEIAKLKEATNFLTSQHKQAYIKGAQDVYNQLKQARNSAIEAGDLVAAEEIRDKMEEQKEVLKTAKTQEVVKPTAPTVSDDFKRWHEKNAWYNKDEDMSALAESIGKRFRQGNPSSSEADMLAHVTKEVKKRFPEKFPDQDAGAPSPNAGGRNRSGGGDNDSSAFREAKNGMTEEQRSIMKTIIKTTGMTEAEYLKTYLA